MGNHYEDHEIRWALTPPSQEVVWGDVAALHHTPFGTPDEAWNSAALTVLKDDTWRGADAARLSLVARDLVDAVEPGECHGWQVTRWAATRVQEVRTGWTLSSAWAESLTLVHRGALEGTYGLVARTMVHDLVEEPWFGVDLAAVCDRQAWFGVAVAVSDESVVTFADGKELDLRACDQISAIYR